MYVPDFIIPLNREDLLKSSMVKEEYSLEETRERLETAKTSLNEEGVDFIIEHFSTYFSLLQKFKQSSVSTREKGWKTLRKGFSLLSRNLLVLFEDSSNIDSDVQNKMCNITKMLLYVLIEFMKLYQDQHVEEKSNLLDGKSKKKQSKYSVEEFDWNDEKRAVLVEINTFLQFPLKMLWEPPVVDEEFINLIANFCYKCLEDPGISNSNFKHIRETIFQILGILIRNYLHGLSFCVKVVQLLKLNDHLVNPLAQGIVYLVKDCSCSNVVKEIVREIADTDGDQLAADSTGTKNLNLFLVHLAESIPQTIIPAIDLLSSHLSGDSYSMRICVVGVLGEIVLTVLTKENLDENMKKMRDDYLGSLEEHIHDVNAFVRTKVLQIWQKLCVGKAIPISRINKLLALIIDRLNDKSTNVKKQAVHLIKDLLEGNPFSSQLNISDIQFQLEQEKKKLELFEKENHLKFCALKWNEIEAKLKTLLEEVDMSPGGEFDQEEPSSSIEEVINDVGNYLIEKNFKKAVSIIVKLKNKFCVVYGINKDTCSPKSLIEVLQKIYQEREKTRVLNISPEIEEKIEKHNKAIEYLENALEFSQLIDRALPIILTFLDSNVVSDVLEAIHFFTAAYLFGFKQALEGVRKMLYLVFSKESNIKSAVSNAYKDLYFQTIGNQRQQSIATVKNLSDLVLKLNYSQLEALEEVIRDWVKADFIDKNCVQVMFERFSMKQPGLSKDQCWAALVLIRMVGAEEPKIIKNNISILLNEGLKNQGSKNFLIAKEACKAFQRLLPPREQGKAFDQTLRYSGSHEIFKALYNLLKAGIWNINDPYYIPMSDEAINLVFAICDQPDMFCKNLIFDLYESITSGKRPAEKKLTTTANVLKNRNDEEFSFEDGVNLQENGENDSGKKMSDEELPETVENLSELFITQLTRFISILGQVASNYVFFLEGPVLDELKLRNQLEYEKKLRKFEENKKFNISATRKNRRGNNESGAEKNMNETGTEDLEFNRVAADDMDADEMRKKTENKIVTGKGFLSKFAPLVLNICKNPGKYNNNPLQNSALLTLSRFMQVSSVFCEENLQLLVTICEKSQFSDRQENAIIALGALQYRFPNSLEPWTPRMYAMLQNPKPSVRYSSILVLTDLIVNEMIKVRSHISNLALCIVDKELRIARVARHFFREYSQKGNSLYNVLPSLISNLTQSDSKISSEEFRVVMKYILNLVTKEKQSEYLVEKLCQYFESARTERQWCDLAYCLSLLNYNDKSLKKILDNVRCFANKLHLSEVYDAFQNIIAEFSKNPQKDKTIVNEIGAIIKEYREKSCEGKSIICVMPKKECPPSVKKRLVRRKYLPSSSSEDEESDKRSRENRQKRKNDVSDSEEDGKYLSDGANKKTSRVRRNILNGKENEILEDSDSEEAIKKSTKKTRRAKSSKKIKACEEFVKGSSEDEDEPKFAVKRSTRKRK